MPLNLSPTQIAFNAQGDGKFNVPFERQVKFLRDKLNLPTRHWDDILKSAHDRAFVVAGAMKADLLKDFHDAINRAALKGKSTQWFRQEFDNIVARNGWSGFTGDGTKAGRDWRARVIYQTNLSASYAAGRWAQLNDPDLLKLRPYWRYVHSDSVRHPRPLHLAWGNKPVVLRHNDPWWRTHSPPNGWGCRCRAVAVRADEYKGDPAPDDGTYVYEDRNGVSHTLPEGIDYGWDYAPGAGVDTALRTTVQDKLIRYPAAITRALSRDVNRYINAHEDIAGFAARAMRERNLDETLWLGFVENAEQIKADTSVDLTGYLVLLQAQNARHIEMSRAFDGKGQRPVEPGDFAGVMDVLLNYESAELGKPSLTQNETLVVLGEFGDERMRLVFEILKGKKNRSLTLLSMVVKTQKTGGVQ